ncbi:MAG TPA: Ig-like domain-containing protein, partial [Candidatus Acidoferrales bacterium]|nr:Ig-like domain-containing protein [Candidatus Acidoferrales bacterium]
MADRPIRDRPLAHQPRRSQPRITRRPAVGSRYRSPTPPSSRRPPGDTGGLPWPARLVLVVAILALGGSVLLVASGMIGSAVTDFGHTLQSMFGAVTGPGATAAPSAVARPSAPHLVTPTNAYTNQPAWDVSGFAPASEVGSAYSVRVYVDGQIAGQLQLGPTADFTVPAVPIPKGRSSITATIVGPGGESDQSAPISVVFDNVPPAVLLSAPTPTAGAVINGGTMTISGRTQTGSTVVVRNDNTRKSTNAVATNGFFSIPVALGPGPNDLTITATDPAGNTTTKTLTVVGGSGQTTVSLHLSNARLALTSLPRMISMAVTVLDMNGAPLEGAQVAFTLQVPGVAPVTFEGTTVGGQVTWETTIPKD